MKRELLFNSEGKFKIMQFTDIHYSDDNEMDHKTTKLMDVLIQEENPDFIMITGDMVYGPNNLMNLDKALKPIIDSKIPWSFTFGNHDTEDGEDAIALFSKLEKLQGTMIYNGDSNISGMGNHYIEVKNKENKTKWILFGLDSGNYNKVPSVGGYSYVKSDQIQWYKEVIHKLNQINEETASLVFMHIPLPEYKEVWEKKSCYGSKNEEVCCPELNSGFFAAMVEEGNTKGVFVGHDHINDYIGNLYGVMLGYGRATGYNTYSQEGYLKGARVMVLDEKNTNSFETYLRLEDGRREF